MTSDATAKQPGSQDVWLEAAYDVLTESGVEAVKVMPLAKRTGLTRSGFYWHFADRDALLEAIVQLWEDKNTGNLIRQTQNFAESITEAMFNVFDCWLDEDLFDARLDLAIRNWAQNDPHLQVRLDAADRSRLAALSAMFQRFGYSTAQAKTRSMTVIYTQIGYISMEIREDLNERIARMPDYIEVFTGLAPTKSEFDRFKSRYL
jgi:AcrR family transcriptional regulator